MEWFVLLVVVPLILVPVVLLWGFSGCDFQEGVLPVDAPQNLRATGISTNEIVLTWDPTLVSYSSVTYEIQLANGEPLATQSGATYLHGSLAEGTAYFYRVRAIREADGHPSPWSEAEGRTRAVAFQKTLTTPQSGFENMCLVQRINKLQYPGTRLWITLRCPASGPLTLDRIFISRVADSPPGDPYDSAVDLTQIASNVELVASQSVELPPVAYTIFPDRPILLAFDVINDNAKAYILVADAPEEDGILYRNDGGHEAAIADRLPSATNPTGTPYLVRNFIAIVEKIVVGYD